MVDDRATHEIRSQCQHVLVSFIQALDDGRGEEAAGFFTEDGVWTRHEGDVVGRGPIRNMIEGRPQGALARHILASSKIDVVSESEAEGCSYYVVYGHAGPNLTLPRPLEGALRAGDYLSRFERTNEGWKISSIAIRRLFERK